MSSKVSKSQSLESERVEELSFREVLQGLKNLDQYTGEDWLGKGRPLWKRFVEILREDELKRLISVGIPQKKARKLVKIAWVTGIRDLDNFTVKMEFPRDSSVNIPVVLVIRQGGFEIHPRIHNFLYDHPHLSKAVEELADQDEKSRVLEILSQVDSVEDELEVGWRGLYHLAGALTENKGKDARLASWGYAAHKLRDLLNPEFWGKNAAENHEWLVAARNEKLFWQLISTAIALGETMACRRILDSENVEELLRKAAESSPGKGTGDEGLAIERMIEAYTLENDSRATPLKLLEWLGGERPYSDEDSLKVEHDLWVGVRSDITWPQFQELVKEAKSRRKLSTLDALM